MITLTIFWKNDLILNFPTLKWHTEPCNLPMYNWLECKQSAGTSFIIKDNKELKHFYDKILHNITHMVQIEHIISTEYESKHNFSINAY